MRAILIAMTFALCADAAWAASIRISFDAVPAPKIDVFFSDVQGELIAHVRTDARGEASARVPPGGSVTVATYDRDLESYELLTMLGIEPADQILVELKTYAITRRVVDLEISMPLLSSGAVRRYQVKAGCNDEVSADDPTEPIELSVRSDCLQSATFDVTARAVDADDNLIAYTYLAGVSPDPSGSMSLTLPAWRTDLFPISVGVIDPPADARLKLTADSVAGHVTAPASSAVEPFPRALKLQSALAERVGLTLIAESKSDQGKRMISRVEPRSPFLAADAGALLPRVIGVGWDATDEKRPSVAFRFDGDPRGADGTWVGISWGAPKPRVNWTLLAPPSPGPIKLLALPPALTEYTPNGQPRFAVATLFDRSAFDRWAQVRVRPTEAMNYVITRAPGEIELRYSQGRSRAQ